MRWHGPPRGGQRAPCALLYCTNKTGGRAIGPSRSSSSYGVFMPPAPGARGRPRMFVQESPFIVTSLPRPRCRCRSSIAARRENEEVCLPIDSLSRTRTVEPRRRSTERNLLSHLMALNGGRRGTREASQNNLWNNNLSTKVFGRTSASHKEECGQGVRGDR